MNDQPIKPLPRMNMITLGVNSFQKSLSFYRDGLGWKPVVQDDIAFFPLNGIVFAIYPREKLAEDADILKKGSGFSGFTLAYNTNSPEEVDHFLMLAEKLGTKILKKGQKAFWGGYHGYFADLDGFIWEIAYNPFWNLDQQGNIILPTN